MSRPHPARILVAAAGLVIALGAAACGGSSARPDAGCATIANVGDSILAMDGIGTPPTPMGGTIADGTYVLTKLEAFPPETTSPVFPFHKTTTLEIAGSTMNVATLNDDNPAGIKGTATLTTSGTQLTITWVCGAGGTFDQGYTATPSELIFIIPPGGVETYSKR